jgi:hypothetical protein
MVESGLSDMARELDPDLRAAARAFVHNAFVGGFVSNLTMSIAIASGVVWLLSTSEAQLPIQMFHMLGYDITHVPGPLGQARMLNFRAILSSEWDASAFALARSGPLPHWQPPPA